MILARRHGEMASEAGLGLRLCNPSTKIVSVNEEYLHLTESQELDESSADLQADLEALRCPSRCRVWLIRSQRHDNDAICMAALSLA